MFCHAVLHFLAVYMYKVCLLHYQFKITFEMLTKKLRFGIYACYFDL